MIKQVLNYKKRRFWIVLFSIIIVAAIGIGLAANSRPAASFNGSSYRVKEILYQAPMYSSIYTLDTAPQYGISSDNKLYSKKISDEDWTMHGGLYRYEISRQELYALFKLPYDNVLEAINKIIDKIKLVYRTDTGDNNKTFYLVMQLTDGNVLLALGYDYDEGGYRHIRCLFRLEKIGDINDGAAGINRNTNDNLSNINDTSNTNDTNDNTNLSELFLDIGGLVQVLDNTGLGEYRIMREGQVLENLWQSEMGWYLEDVCKELGIKFIITREEKGYFGSMLPVDFYIENNGIRLTFSGKKGISADAHDIVVYDLKEKGKELSVLWWRSHIRVDVLELLNQLEIKYDLDESKKMIIVK